MNEIRKRLAGFPYWDKLDEWEKEYAVHNSYIKHYEKGQMLCGGGMYMGMGYVIEGDIRVYISSEEGREVTLFHLGSGDPSVLSASYVIKQIDFDLQMAAETDSRIMVVNMEAFEYLMERNIYVKCFAYEVAAKRFSSVMQVLQHMMFFKFDRRLASFLLDEYERSGNTEIPVTHARVAKRINSAREVVARTLREFEESGLVKRKRGAIRLTDLEGLKSIRDSCE